MEELARVQSLGFWSLVEAVMVGLEMMEERKRR
jgi:hypothetical protein